MKIDVVIPVRNGSTYINRAIESALRQQFLGKIFVINDGSTDDTVNQIEIANYGPGVVIVNREATGLSSTRNFGVSVAESDWVAFLDSDDYWAEGKLEAHVYHIRTHKDCCLSFTGAVDFNEVGKILSHQKPNLQDSGDFNSVISQTFKVTGSASSVVINSKLLKESGGFNENLPYGEDWDLWIKLSLKHDLCQIPGNFTYICIRGDSMQRQQKKGLEKFADSQIHIYEIHKYREVLSRALIEEVACVSLWADFRKSPRNFILHLSRYRRYISETYPEFTPLLLLSSNFTFVLRILFVKIRIILNFGRDSLA